MNILNTMPVRPPSVDLGWGGVSVSILSILVIALVVSYLVNKNNPK